MNTQGYRLTIMYLLLVLVLTGCVEPERDATVEPAAAEPVAAAVDAFDYARAAEISAFRWQAMARAYEAHGMLTRDPFDYEQAAENLAFRWQAMARAYEALGMLTRDPFDDEQEAENLAFPWQGMARYYESHGMLPRSHGP